MAAMASWTFFVQTMICFDKGLDQVEFQVQRITDFEPELRPQVCKIFRGNEIVGNHLELPVHEDHERAVQLEEQFGIFEFE